MESYEALVTTIALTMGVSWASGINLYAAVLVLGLGGASGNIVLPAELAVLQDPLIIAAAGFMYFIEFFADKTPGIDSSWDVLHTFIRIPAGAVLAAGAVGDVSPALAIAAGIVGGGIAATSHATKAGTRLAINTSPEPVSNWTASIMEDVMVLAGLWTALNHPVLFIVLVILFLILAAWLLPKLWRFIKLVFRKVGEFLGLVDKQASAQKPSVEPFAMGDLFNSTAGQFAGSEAVIEDRYSRLQKLKSLLDSGAITQEEFEREKKRLFGDQ
ncbi:hypothetical protein BTA51_17025 [Hahella sp. CCB-MM4]|uniref:DUF4126 family protein n=1 Tax=Hahella sp. (strain CCB-MM4) TaxID=1926491 RepID=UPI000B9B3BFD|nr:DUF4126 family protein [Hahella sp. CCB-MM4]OZG72073.1 hypothetical protein BTA51_17025 [Hahella sp. CCB-MM4]